jgi:hypothetical protein
MSKQSIFLISALTFSIGVVFGFLIAPMKQGIGNGSGNVYNYYGKKEESEEENTDNEQTDISK